MYQQSSFLIVGILFVSLLVAIEAGYRIGRRVASDVEEASRTHVNTVQASLIGLLALLLGFSFSMALHRYEMRSVAVAEEANVAGTTYLRAELLPVALRAPARELLRRFVDQRISAGTVNLAQEELRAEKLKEIDQTFAQLWSIARQAAAEDGRPVTSGFFIQSLNDLIDSYGRRNASLDRHVPEVVLHLLFGTFLLAAAIVGYAAGLAEHRASFVTYLMVGLIALLVFIVIDLDRPRRGFIEVDHGPLIHLRSAFAESP